MAIELAENCDLYYEAMKRAAIRQARKTHQQNPSQNLEIPAEPEDNISEYRKRFVYAFKPDHMLKQKNESLQMTRRMKVLYGATQMDN